MNKTLTEIQNRLAVALNALDKAKPYVAEENPLASATLDTLIRGAGIKKHGDLMPQKNAYGFITQAEALNGVVLDGLVARKNGRGDQRKKRARDMAARKQQIDAIIDSPVQPDSKRLTASWVIVEALTQIIARIALSKAQWAQRYLGHVQDDVAQEVAERMVRYFAKSDLDLALYALAAAQVAGQAESTTFIPGDQATVEVPGTTYTITVNDEKAVKKARKAEARARKSLMGLCNHMVMTTLADLYRSQNNLRWENLDIIETVMVNINGVGDDPAFAQHNASKAPCFIASRMPQPGRVDPDVLAMAISGAITDRGLDRLVELLLDRENCWSNGSFVWSEHAEQVFMCLKDGEVKWGLVVNATEHHKNARASRADAARDVVRQEFEFLPSVIHSVIEACDAQRVAWWCGRAQMASAFDPDTKAEDGSRKRRGYLVPTIVAADAHDAARLVCENLGTEVIDWFVHA